MKQIVPVLLLLLASCGRPAPGPRTRPPPLVTVATVTSRDVPVEVRAPIDLRPLTQADVGSKILGYLDAVLVDRGDRVKRGQLIALVRPSDLPDQLTAARGTLAQNQANLALARANLERARTLAPSGVVSQQELQQASSAFSSADASRAAAQANIGALGVRLNETRIESPLDGFVSQRRLDPGALVGPPGGGAILTVVRIDVLRVFIPVNELDAAGISLGQDAHVEVSALPGRSFSGKVVRLAPAFDPNTRTLDAEVHLRNDSAQLRPGMYGRGTIVVQTHPHMPVVPDSAVQISADRHYVFVLGKDDHVQRRTVEIGVDGGTWLGLTKGLLPGEEIVTAGTDGLADGAQVRVLRNVDPFTGAPEDAAAR